MKNIKVFIASSAELDEDKTQFDLYFAQKNKVYSKRYITFEQKTWRDFPSYLSETQLQDRYDEYIRQCDIVIFLFHTRMGQYTLRELEVAYRQFKQSGGKRPKVYIYVKRDEAGAELLEKLKQFSETEYGHFCDTYSDYNELFRHFDYQISQMENSGFIHPDPVDVPRTARFVLLSVLPLLLVGLGLLAYRLSQSETMKVSVEEQVHTALPFKGATLTLRYADEEKVYSMESPDETVTFSEIPVLKKWFGMFRLKYRADGYLPVDTAFSFLPELTLPVIRDGKAGLMQGIVSDDERTPIKGARVSVGVHTVVTDANGAFTLQIPLKEQTSGYRMTVTKDGFVTWDYSDVTPSETEPMRIMLHR